MLPGIITQVSLTWDSSINYYIPTIKQHKGRFYAWKATSGPSLGGAKEPSSSPDHWELIDSGIFPHTVFYEENDWDELKKDGKYFMQTTQNISVHPPMNLTAWWWVEVSTVQQNEKLQVLQVARQHGIEAGTSAKVLSRCFNGVSWGGWSFNYTQYAG